MSKKEYRKGKRKYGSNKKNRDGKEKGKNNKYKADGRKNNKYGKSFSDNRAKAHKQYMNEMRYVVEKYGQDTLDEKSENIFSFISDNNYVPMNAREIAGFLSVSTGQRDLFNAALKNLLNQGRIRQDKGGKYRITDNEIIEGRFIAHEKGFGFLEVDDRDEDYYIPADRVGGAFHHDRVIASVEKTCAEGKRKEGSIIKVVSHECTQVVGYFKKNNRTGTYGHVICDNKRINRDIFIRSDRTMGAHNGTKVVAKILDYGSTAENPEGEITEILGYADDPGIDILSIVKSYGIPQEFPDEVDNYLDRIPDIVSEAAREGRYDIRHLQTVTIDGESTKDFDDAVTCTKDGDNYILGVHIADVAEYVTEGSPLDKEAIRRGTSVYLTDRVIPMLPRKLSNGICSLNQGEDRLTLSCFMRITKHGDIIGHEIVESVINVDARMTYTSVDEIINQHRKETIDKYKDLQGMFDMMASLSRILREKRHDRGSVSFNSRECEIRLDEDGYPVDIRPYVRNEATMMIEDFMVAANETVAEEFCRRGIPFVYRNHSEPDMDRMMQLNSLMTNLGYHIRFSNNHVQPKEVQNLLEAVEDTPVEILAERVTLRSMQRAEYNPCCEGHFGLAAKYYCHFTSPIRRYPDLQIHRIIKETLHGNMDGDRAEHYKSILPEVTKKCSEYERRADDAQRDTDSMKKAEYMSGFIGEEYRGVISSITSFGIYVELPNTVEGLVHVSNMKDDHYLYDDEKFTLTGERGGRMFKLGQTVKVRVEASDKSSGNIDFSLA